MSEDSRRKKFGNRHLKEEDDVFSHNAWDDVPWDEEHALLGLDGIEFKPQPFGEGHHLIEFRMRYF